MSSEQMLQYVPAFVLVFFRLAGMMAFAPLFGSSRIPKRVKVLMVSVLAMAVTGSLGPAVRLPPSIWQLAVGIGGELMFGVAMGLAMSFTFTAAQWAGEMIGQQMGLNLSEVFDPQFGGQSTVVGDMYFMLTLVVFLLVRGHHAMLMGVRDSFDALPLLSVGITPSLLQLIIGLFRACTMLAIQLAAPMLVTMLVVDVALGFISKTMPQFNVMTLGLSMRSAVGMLVLIVGMGLSSSVIRGAVIDSMNVVRAAWSTPVPPAAPAGALAP
jgi:flagellar biosynthetic protein FliR